MISRPREGVFCSIIQSGNDMDHTILACMNQGKWGLKTEMETEKAVPLPWSSMQGSQDTVDSRIF